MHFDQRGQSISGSQVNIGPPSAAGDLISALEDAAAAFRIAAYAAKRGETTAEATFRAWEADARRALRRAQGL